tara:strand:+ start:561 stop:1901 length:1341 start_codon:yes stop_codon:yes gene_type:complete
MGWKLSTILALLILSNSCSTSEDITVSEDENNTEDILIIAEEDQTKPVENFTPEGQIEIFNQEKLDDNYILVNDAGANRVYLMNKEAKLLYEWSFTNNIGNDVYLLPNGNLLASLEADDPQIQIGGKGGRIQLVQPNGSVEWDFIYSSTEGETHHDIELLPNGNIIAMVWKSLSDIESAQIGYMKDEGIFIESIIEINPKTNQIVWEWNSLNHLVQDYDITKPNYGGITENPNLIDINYIPRNDIETAVKGDLMHANAIAYDDVNDVILLSVNYYSEVWAVDHSTTTEEAVGHVGGNFGKGGDLIYRFGNPETYQNPKGTRLFHNNHFPNLLKGEDQGKLLIFSNGNDIKQSAVYELELPSIYSLQPNFNNEPTVTWSFTDPNLYSEKVSGAVLLENGNILITEGDFGFWEVTREKEVVWKFSAPGFYWRGYSYLKNSPEINILGL